jgi:Outer membrane protein beta-barrel domain
LLSGINNVNLNLQIIITLKIPVMKIYKFTLIILGLLLALNINAQESPQGLNGGSSSKFSISAGAGTANYYGDLMQKSGLYSQTSFSFSAGVAYSFISKLSGRFDFGIQKVQAADSKSKGAQYKARNLSFKSTVFDMALSAEYSILDVSKFPATPYISAGVGIMFFDPYANGANGKKQKLRELGTEGQGLAAYPNRKIYKKSAVEFPLGIGVKYPLSERLNLQLEFNYHITGTDYLDDVSTNGYPDKTLLDARNPTTAKFTWRGNEVGGEAYPKNLALPRGNPKDKDGFFTTQLKVAFNL